MTFLVRVILALSVRRPFWVAAVFLPLALVLAFGIGRIGFEDGLRSVFASESAAFHDYVASSEKFAHSETDIAVLISAKNPLDAKTLTVLQDFVIESQFLDGVDAVFSLFSLRDRDPVTGKSLPLLQLEDNPAGIEAALRSVNGQAGTGTRMISQDLKETVVILSLSEAITDMKGTSKTLAQMNDLAAQTMADSGITIGVTGLLAARDTIILGLKKDQMRINLLGALAGYVISFFLFRSFWVTLLNATVPLSALLFCLGIYGWTGQSINALTNALPVLILVLASSDSIHMTYEVRRQMAAGHSLQQAVRISVKDLAGPCVLTSLTTVLAFASLLYSDSPVVRDMAVAGAIGVIISMLTVLFLHPVVFLIGGRLSFVARALPLRDKTGNPDAMGNALFRRLAAWPRLLAVVGIVSCVLSLALLFPLQASYRFMENIDAGQPVARVLAKVETVVGPISSIDIPITLPAGKHAWDADVLAELARLHAKLETIPDISAVLSLDTLARQLDTSDQRPVAVALKDVLDQLPGRFRNRMTDDAGTSLQIMLLTGDQGSQAILALVDRINDVIEAAAPVILQPGQPTGFLAMSASLASSMIRQLTVSFMIAALICPLLIGLWFRRLDFALAATVPNILPIALVGAALTIGGIGIQFTSALALTIAFGIALDDSIHVFNRLVLQEKTTGQRLTVKAITRAISHIAPVLITTTIVLSVGVLATQVSDMPMVRLFGVLSVITFVLALLSDLFFLPALVAQFSFLARKDKMNS